jgi:hypothetical protein
VDEGWTPGGGGVQLDKLASLPECHEMQPKIMKHLYL